MKFVRFLSWLAYWLVRLLGVTLRVRHVHPEHLDDTPQHVLAFWHRQLLPMLARSRWRKPVMIMASRSKDGDLSSSVSRRFGIESARGSSSRGGSTALREFLRAARDGTSLVFTPDGPRGPSEVVKDGVIFAARASRLPIVPVALAVKRAKLLGSWDRMIVPWPFTTCVIVYGAPFEVPRHGDVEEWSLILEKTLKDLTALAEELVKQA